MPRFALQSGGQFPDAWRVGDLVFVSGQVSMSPDGTVIGPGDIEVQTRTAFSNLGRVLAGMGCDMGDLVKLNTYLVFNGAEDDFANYWGAMNRVRREFITAPGPAATALRVSGLAIPGLLIEIDGIAAIAPR
jgi:2-iminobutanoate/2-iminopropanoate deaminase